MRAFTPFLAILLVSFVTLAAEPEKPAEGVKKPKPNSADEPVAREFSKQKGAEFLDAVAINWTRERKCGTCHTNIPYLMASSSVPETKPEARREVRVFFEEWMENWEKSEKTQRQSDTESITTALALAFDDAQTTQKLHPATKKALDKMLSLQNKPSGAWNWAKCNWPPLEHDDFVGVAYAALALGYAPENYAATEPAQEALGRIRMFFNSNRPPDLHHKALLLWVSQKIGGLMTPEEQAATIKELLAAQRPDGGWSLPMLGGWRRRDGAMNDQSGTSDGYGTGFVTYVLRQSGVPGKDERLQRAVSWLKANQRESGRWFTRSLNNDRAHYVTNVGSAYAMMAIQACAE